MQWLGWVGLGLWVKFVLCHSAHSSKLKWRGGQLHCTFCFKNSVSLVCLQVRQCTGELVWGVWWSAEGHTTHFGEVGKNYFLDQWNTPLYCALLSGRVTGSCYFLLLLFFKLSNYWKCSDSRGLAVTGYFSKSQLSPVLQTRWLMANNTQWHGTSTI